MPHKEAITRPDANHVIGAVRKGLPAGRLNQVARLLNVERTVLLDILGISERTVQRRRLVSAPLSPTASDRLARIDRIFQLAAEVLGDQPKAAQWLQRPNRALGNELPLRLLDTDAGSQQVERELRQVEHSFVF